MTALFEAIGRVADLGGPVVMILLAMSLIALALILAKVWQFHRLGVGLHRALETALAHWDTGGTAQAVQNAANTRSHLGPIAVLALKSVQSGHHDEMALRARLTGEAATRLSALSSGLRILDSVAQVAPLLGLFGTVLGMIEAFQGLQAAGASVDPSALAGGIWVALLTTAVGLAVAMPSSLILAWFDGRIAREAAMAERIIDTALCAGLGAAPEPGPQRAPLGLAHA